MTPNEKALVAALEADNQMWEVAAGHYERYVADFQSLDGRKMTGREYAVILRQRIVENRALVESVKKGGSQSTDSGIYTSPSER